VLDDLYGSISLEMVARNELESNPISKASRL